MALQQSQVEQGRQATGDAVMRPAHLSLIRSKDFAAIGHCHDRCGSRYCLHLLPTCGSVRVLECHLSLFSLRCTISINLSDTVGFQRWPFCFGLHAARQA